MKKWAVVLVGCAWVLWEESYLIKSGSLPSSPAFPSWSILMAYDSHDECLSKLFVAVDDAARASTMSPGWKKAEQNLGAVKWRNARGDEHIRLFRCLPDTIDPRGKK